MNPMMPRYFRAPDSNAGYANSVFPMRPTFQPMVQGFGALEAPECVDAGGTWDAVNGKCTLPEALPESAPAKAKAKLFWAKHKAHIVWGGVGVSTLAVVGVGAFLLFRKRRQSTVSGLMSRMTRPKALNGLMQRLGRR